MSFVAATLLVVLGAAPADVDAVLITRKSGLTAPQAADLQLQLERSLVSGGLTVQLTGPALTATLKKLGVKDTAACNGRRSCVNELITQLQVATVVAVSASRVDGETAIALELLRAGEAQPAVKDGFIIPPKGSLDPLVASFVARARELLGVRAPKPEPVATPVLTPPPSPPPVAAPPVIVAPVAPAPSRSTPVVLATLGGVSAAAGVALIIVSVVARGTLQPNGIVGALKTSTLDDATATRVNTEANIALGSGLGAAALGAGLLTGAIVTW